MTYSVYQHWDPLKAMAVGSSYPPEFYDYIKNEKVRNVFYKIAEETEEDYQKLSTLLQSFNVDVFRMPMDHLIEKGKQSISEGTRIQAPITMVPRDYSVTVGDTFYCTTDEAYKPLMEHVANTGTNTKSTNEYGTGYKWQNIDLYINGAQLTRIGKDLYIGSLEKIPDEQRDAVTIMQNNLRAKFPDYRLSFVDSQGHTDATFCPASPGLILSIESPINYTETFPSWEVVYLPNESWHKIGEWHQLKAKNRGKWWVPGQELNQDFTDYVETWMNHWVGYVEESVFDVNMIVIDRNNVVVNGYNQQVFDALSKRGITPHICNFRHRYFWDGGLHCVTSDLNRGGVMTDWFPERNQ